MFEAFIATIIAIFIGFCIGYNIAKYKYKKVSSDDMLKIAKLFKKIAKDRKKRARERSTSTVKDRFTSQKS